MSGPCRGACVEPVRFPAPVENRPGLPRIACRIGAYASIRQALLRRLDLAPELAAWTHRAPDDPGIALLEGAAIVGDVLTLYHEAYANEAYLRTARWRESVADLVRLTGYRLSPGVAGRAAFAFEVRGGAPVTIPAGFPLTAQVTGVEGTVDWETAEPLAAYPALGRFSLYRPFATPNPGPATPTFRVAGPEPDAPAAVLRPGDRLVVGDALPAGAPLRLENAEIVVIDSVRTLHGRPLYTLRGVLARAPTAGTVAAYRLGRSFRHFGYNAPPTKTVVTAAGVAQVPVAFTRPADKVEEANVDPPLAPDELPLDAEVDDLARGATVVVQTRQRGSAATLLRTVVEVRPGAYTWGSVTGGSTVLKLSADLDADRVAPPSAPVVGKLPDFALGSPVLYGSVVLAPAFVRLLKQLDVRDVAVHETVGPMLTLQAGEEAAGAASGTELFFLGTAAEAAALAGRRVLLEGLEENAVEAVVAAVAPAPAGEDARRILRGVSLDRRVDYASFPLDDPSVVVYGNVALATQGKSERETVLGGGDAREAFQTFALPKAPLTYLVSAGAAPPEVPELAVYVAGRAWTRVPTFFGRGPLEEVYVVREDAEGTTRVQFGDGKTGARLPSGVGNVTAAYRVGVGAFGALRADTGVAAGARLERLEKVRLPGAASGGTVPNRPRTRARPRPAGCRAWTAWCRWPTSKPRRWRWRGYGARRPRGRSAPASPRWRSRC